ncbi:Ig-like domain-containing protein [Chloroflexota bacterium]
MKINRKLVTVSLVVAICLNFLPAISPVSPARADVSWTRNSANPVFTENQTALTTGPASVIYDSNEKIYKMWYTEATSNVSAFDEQIDNILGLDIASLINDLKSTSFTSIANNDAANVTAVISYLATLNATELQTLLIGTGSTIGYATSYDGVTWQFTSNVLSSSNTWEQYGISNPSVIHHSGNNTYEMWYTGTKLDLDAMHTLLSDLSLLSTANLSLLLGDIAAVDIASFISHARAARGDAYLVDLVVDVTNVLGGMDVAIGHATSADGINWTKDGSTPVLQEGAVGSWEKFGVANPAVLYDSASSNYKMWYTGWQLDYSALLGLLLAENINEVVSTLLSGINMAIGYATSTDGTSWTKYASNPVLPRGASSAWDGYGVFTPSVIRNSATSYEMWYTGINVVADNLMDFIEGDRGFANSLINGTDFTIGHATSADGISWTKDGSTPVLQKGSYTAWDGYGICAPSVIKVGNTSQMWYTGGKLNISNLIIDVLDGSDLSPALSNTKMYLGHAYSALRTLQSIAVTSANYSVIIGDTRQFTATGTYSDGSTEDLTTATGIAWSSSTTGRATISPTTGLATGVAVGSTLITASRSGITSSTATLGVIAPPLLSITISPTTAEVVAGGAAQQFTATGTFTNGPATITDNVTWTSSNSSIASIETEGQTTPGQATGNSLGAVTITATKSGKSATANLTVTAAEVSSVDVTPVDPTITVNSTQPFRAMATYTDGAVVEKTTTANWTSDDEVVATISTAGVATGLAAGSAVITANVSGQTDTSTLTVTADSLESIAVTPAAPSVNAGQTKQFIATGNYSGTYPIMTNTVTWSSSNPTVARIKAGGLATSYATGNTTITATSGNVSGNTTLTVTAAVLDSVTVTPVNPAITFVSGAPPTLQFTATAIYTDGSTTDNTSNAAWSSLTPTTANITATGAGGGLATALQENTSIIRANLNGTIGETLLTVNADKVAPVVRLTSPSDGLTVTSTTLTVSGSVDDVNVATLRAIVNGGTPGTNLLPLVGGNFSASVTLQTGSNTVLVKAVDGAGNIGISGTRTVVVDPLKPVITITSPAEGLITGSSALNVSGTIAGATSATLRLNGTAVATVSGSTFTQAVTLREGKNTIVVSGYATGQSTSAYLGTSGTRTVTLDTTAPTVAITSPSSGSKVNTPKITVSGTVNDPTVTSAALTVRGGTPKSVAVVGGNFSQEVTLTTGNNIITVTATDNVSNTSSPVSITAIYDNTVPQVTVTAPVNNRRTNVASQLVTGNVDDPSITSATLYLNGSTQTISVAPGGSFGKTVPLRTGANTIEVRATDGVNTGTSGVINVTLENTAPTLAIGLTDPTDSITVTVNSNEALTAAGPTVNVNATAVVMTRVAVNRWTGVFEPIPAGQYTVTATGTDLAGNTATVSSTFTKQTVTITEDEAVMVQNDTTTMEINTTANVTDASISVTQYNENPSENTASETGAGIFIEIVASADLMDNLESIYITVAYDEDYILAQGIVESSLRLYLWSMSTGQWEIVSGSGVNVDLNYIYGTVDHLSKYGGFGSISTPAPPSPPSVSAGGGGDSRPPKLSNITAKNIAKTSVTIEWTTNEICTSQVEYWASPGILSPLDGTMVTSHSVLLTNLLPATTYHYKTMSKDRGGNLVVSDEYTFTTLGMPATFTIFGLSVSPAEVDTGASVTISVTVANTGDAAGSYEVTLKINGAAVETKTVTLTGGSSEKVTFTTSQATAGTYSIDINGQPGTLTVKAVAPPPPPPPPTVTAFSISGLSVSPAEVGIGAKVTISVTAANTGNAAGSYEVTLRINGAAVETKTVTLAGGSSEKVTFTTTRDTAGTYTVDINGLSGTFKVKEAPAEEVPPKPMNWWLIGGIIAAAVIVIGLFIWRFIRRRITG